MYGHNQNNKPDVRFGNNPRQSTARERNYAISIGKGVMIDESVIDERIRGSDWDYAFGCCGTAVSVALGSTVNTTPFGRDEVADVIACADGDPDGPDWIGVFRLKDGRFTFISAGCAYSGWDVWSHGHSTVSHSLEHLIQFGMTDSAREVLGL